MTTRITIPDELRGAVVTNFGPRGQAWIDALPRLINRYLENWDLTLDLLPGTQTWHGRCGIVVPVRCADDTAAVLKISVPHGENTHEHTALSLWNGSGAARLYDADPQECALLIERLDGTRDLTSVPIDEAAAVFAELLNQLAVPVPQRSQIERMDNMAARWVEELPARWESLGPAAPRRALIDRAVAAAHDLGPGSGDALIHTDLHYENVLAASSNLANDRGPWLAIDPKPLAGDLAFAVAPMLWNRLGDLGHGDRSAALRQRMSAIVEAAGLDAERVREWSIAREVENIIHYTESGRDLDRDRSLWVAESLEAG